MVQLTCVYAQSQLLRVPGGDLGPGTPSETALEIRLERMHVAEALDARDAVARQLAEACASVRQKTIAIDGLQRENAELRHEIQELRERSAAGDEHADCQMLPGAELNKLAEISRSMEELMGSFKNDEGGKKLEWEGIMGRLIHTSHNLTSPRHLRDISNDAQGPLSPAVTSPNPALSPVSHTAVDDVNMQGLSLEDPGRPMESLALGPSDRMQARNSILAALPLPSEVPPDVLRPIVIPSPFTLHDFLGTVPAQSTTSWCTEREEHGYFLTPVFKCTTNPRVSTAHRWAAVDKSAKLDKSTECFYNRDGKWYYAGTYRAFWLDELAPQEWETLPTETTQALTKETLAGRKNTCPQNVYEVAQLYAAGALRVACIGLQCIGFNHVLYRTVMEHAARCAQMGKWRGSASGSGASHGSAWSANVHSLSPNTLTASPVIVNHPEENVVQGDHHKV
ncbi:hypothetical protein WOLCODRAFT_97291 [Wolfiporia cocos MD-104 SS10]|uniref:DUF6697 domain-containing protein n=1 Tax=Wolfiporia cocos (strain MD-104) TaxID=742152 RepID=A0A2H3J8J9_WOLCO|nr:hypothetical protein WOLCODRAFT_97291 [Wolfiporia cocos MD-104 SS10]